MELPTTCWVLTGVEDHLIKDASPEWFALWDMPAKESIGKPISILNERAGSDNEASALLMANFNRDGFAKVRSPRVACQRSPGHTQRPSTTARRAAQMHCTNARADGTIIGHDIELKKTAKGLLATSTEIASCDALFPSKKRPPSVRDMEVFGTTGHYAKAAATASRRGGGRDDEYFGSDDAEEMPAAAASFTALFAPGTGRLSARDLEVFGPSESHSIPTPAVPVRQPSARDQEYFDDGFESHVPRKSKRALLRDLVCGGDAHPRALTRRLDSRAPTTASTHACLLYTSPSPRDAHES
eukprot:4932060-Prymnesium_polylepis.1